MIPSLYFHAIDLNNCGTSYLEEGDLLEAQNAFRLAMDAITKCMSRKDDPQYSDRPRSAAQLEWVYTPSLPLHTFQPVSFVFQHPIRIAIGCSDSSDCHLESASIVWNMGLCFHLMGLSFNKAQYLDRALRFYDIALVIRGNKLVTGGTEILDLVLQNNMGQIHCEFLGYNEALPHFQKASLHLAKLQTTGLIEFVARNDADGLVMNILLCEEPSCSAAA